MAQTIPTPVTTNPSTSAATSLKANWRTIALVTAPVVLAAIGYYLYSSSDSSTSSNKKKKSSKGKRSDKKKKAGSSVSVEDLRPGEVVEVSQSNSEEALLQNIDINTLSEKEKKDHANKLKEQGNKYFSGRKYEKAIELYDQAIAITPEDAIFYNNRAACNANLGNFQKVLEDTTKALELNPTYVKAFLRRAEAFEKTSELKEALNDYTAVCLLESFANSKAVGAIDVILKELAQEEAKKTMQGRKAFLPSSTFVTAFFHSFFYEYPELIVQEEEEDGESYLALALLAMKNKSFSAMLKHLQSAFENQDTIKSMALALDLRGSLSFLMGETDIAFEDFEKALELTKESDDMKNLVILLMIKKATVLLEKGDMTNVMAILDDVEKIDPSNPNLYYQRAQILLLSGEFKMASAEYEKAIQQAPTFIFAHIQYGVALYRSNQIPEAFEHFQKIVKDFSSYSDVYNYYGELLLDQSRIDEAVEQFEKAIELEGSSAVGYINKALVQFQIKRDFEGGEYWCRKAIEADPMADMAYSQLAQILLHVGKIEESLDYFSKVTELTRTEPELVLAFSFKFAAQAKYNVIKRYPTIGEMFQKMQAKIEQAALPLR